MSDTKSCLKCGHKAAFDGTPPLDCPNCGAIYSKVEEALRSGATIRPKPPANEPEINFFKPSAIPSMPSASRHDSSAELDIHAFAQTMRNESLYPAWRKIVGFFAILGYAIAAIAFISGLVAAFKVSMLSGLIGFGTAALIAILAKVSKEASLMLADLSDAAVRLAASSKTPQ